VAGRHNVLFPPHEFDKAITQVYMVYIQGVAVKLSG
jgi:hypothetical protein